MLRGGGAATSDAPLSLRNRAALAATAALAGADVAALFLTGRMPASWVAVGAAGMLAYAAIGLRFRGGFARLWLLALPLAMPAPVFVEAVADEGVGSLNLAGVARDSIRRPLAVAMDLFVFHSNAIKIVFVATGLALLVHVPLRVGRALDERLVVRASVWLSVCVATTVVAREAFDWLGRGGLAAWPGVVSLALAAMALALASRDDLTLSRALASRPDEGGERAPRLRRRARALGVVAGAIALAAVAALVLALHARPLGGVVALSIPGAVGTTCALRGDGTVLCWGKNDQGQLGDEGRAPRDSPVPIRGVADAIQLDDDDTCALRRGGELFCWGQDGAEQRKKIATLPRARWIGGGCALLEASDDVLCWREAGRGLGSAWVRVAKAPGATRVVRTAYGGCARADDGLHCWGRKSGAPDPLGKQPECLPPWAAPGGATAPAAERIGADRVLFEILDDGTLRTWDPFPQGSPPHCREPTTFPGVPRPRRLAFATFGMKRETAIAYCAIGETREVTCWDFVGKPYHHVLEGAVDLVADRDGRFCAARADGTAWCWGGRNSDGQYGDGTRRASDEARAVVR